MQGIIDSHAHICGAQLYQRWEAVVAGAKEAGIEKIMIVCTELFRGGTGDSDSGEGSHV